MKTAGDNHTMVLTEEMSGGGHPENVAGGKLESKEGLCGHPVNMAPVESGKRCAGVDGGRQFAGLGGEVFVEKFTEEFVEVVGGDGNVFNVVKERVKFVDLGWWLLETFDWRLLETCGWRLWETLGWRLLETCGWRLLET